MKASLLGAITQVRDGLVVLGECSASEQFVSAQKMLEIPGLEVVIFGAFNRGKSTLINALLGEYILPAKLVPTTGHVTRISYGVSPEVRVLLRDGSHESCRLNELDQFSLFLEGRARDDIESIVVTAPSAILKRGLSLVDTPGIQDSEPQTRRAELAVAAAHLVLMVLDAQQPLAQWEQNQARRFIENQGKPLLLIVNKMNLIDTSQRTDVIRRIDHWARRYLPVELRELGRPYLEINALGGLRAALNLGPKPSDDFVFLRELLSQISPLQVQEMRSRGFCGYLRSELARVRAANDRLLWQLQDSATEVERRRFERVESLMELNREFKAMAELLEESVMLFAQKRLSQFEEKSVRTQNNGAVTGRSFAESFEEALTAIEGEAGRMVVGFERGVLSNPMPFTVAEEVALQLRAESTHAVDSTCTATIGARGPVFVTKIRKFALAVLQSQVRERIAAVRLAMDRELRERRSSASSAAEELRLRQSLEKALGRLDTEIKNEEWVARVTRRAYDLSLAGVGNSAEENWALAVAEVGEVHEPNAD